MPHKCKLDVVRQVGRVVMRLTGASRGFNPIMVTFLTFHLDSDVGQVFAGSSWRGVAGSR